MSANIQVGDHPFLLIKNEEDSNKELSGMGFCSNCGPFTCICNNHSEDDSEMIELALMGKSEIKQSEEKTNSKMLALEA